MSSNKFLILILILSGVYLVIQEVNSEDRGKLSKMFKLDKIDEEVNKIPSMFGFGISEAIESVKETSQDVSLEAQKDLNPLTKIELQNEVKTYQKEMFGPKSKNDMSKFTPVKIGQDPWSRDVKTTEPVVNQNNNKERPWGGWKEF